MGELLKKKKENDAQESTVGRQPKAKRDHDVVNFLINLLRMLRKSFLFPTLHIHFCVGLCKFECASKNHLERKKNVAAQTTRKVFFSSDISHYLKGQYSCNSNKLRI